MAGRIDPQDPGAFNNLGVLYFSKGMFVEAVDALLRALSLDSRMRIAARNLEIAAAKPGACDARLLVLDRVLAAHPDDLESRRQRARLLRLIGRQSEATQQLDTLIAEDPDDGAALFERGLIEQHAGDLRRAQRWFERAVNAALDNPIPRLHLAEVLYQRGQNEQALIALDAVIARDPRIADAHLVRGFVLGDLGRHEAALDASRQASALNPALQALQPHLSIEGATSVAVVDATPSAEHGLARYGLGLAFRQRGYFDEARREFERALAQGADARLVRHALAELDLVGGDFASALRAYEELLTEYADAPRYWNEYGVALHQRGDVAAAADAYRHALRCDPLYALAYNNLGVALDDLGDVAAARDAFAQASELDPTLVRARLNLAMWHRRQGTPMSAMSVLRELVAFHAEDAEAWHALGVVCRDLGWMDEARAALARAVEQRADHAEARYVLGEVLSAQGDADGALRETQQALSIAPVRREVRLSVAIDLQRECPEACGTLALLTTRSVDPLLGVAIDEAEVASLLPEVSVAALADLDTEAGAERPDALRRARRACDDADGFAVRGLHGEAGERYAQVRALLDEWDGSSVGAESSPDRAALWRRAALGEAQSHCLLGQAAQALPVLKRLGSQDAWDSDVLALFARSAAASRQTDVAREAIVRCLGLEPSNAALIHFLGESANQIGDQALALGCYRRALAIDPTRPSARVAIARLLRARGDLLAARLELVAALSTAPASRDATLELVLVHRDADRPREALAVLTQYLSAMPTDLDALVLLAETLLQLQRDDDARVAVVRVLRHDPAHMPAVWLDGLLLSRQSRMREAFERWRRVADDETDQRLAATARRALADAQAPSLSAAVPSAALDGAAVDGAPREGASRDAASRDGASRDGASRDGASRDAARGPVPRLKLVS